jgi:hypothetical protein
MIKETLGEERQAGCGCDQPGREALREGVAGFDAPKKNVQRLAATRAVIHFYTDLPGLRQPHVCALRTAAER